MARYRDPLRLLAPVGAVLIPAMVATLLLVMTTIGENTSTVYLNLEIAKEECIVDPLEAIEDEEECVEEISSEDISVPDEAIKADLPEIAVEIPMPAKFMEPLSLLPRHDLVELIHSPVQLRTLAGASRGFSGRTEAIRKHGGNDLAEAAVMRALRWLKTQQQPNGCWQAKGEGDETAFALLAYLSHGETFQSPEFGETVKKALSYIVDHHSNNMAVYALVEASAIIRTPVLKEIAEEAVDSLCKRQKAKINANAGGVIPRYCAVMSLKSAKLAGLNVPSMGNAWNAFVEGYSAMRDKKAGNWEKIKGLGTWHYMIAGACLQYLGHGEDLNTWAMMNRLKSIWEPATLGSTTIACCPVRSNYFSTIMFFNAGGEMWKRWNEGMLAAYVQTQEIEDAGYCDHEGIGKQIGYWHCEDQHIGEQPFWTTCYVAHQLMVYYRYLPTYSETAWADMPVKDHEIKLPEVAVEVDI